MELLDRFYELLGMNNPDTPVYFKIVVPLVFLSMAIVIPIYIYNTAKGIIRGAKNIAKGAANITSGLVGVARGIRVRNDAELSSSQVRRIAIGALYANQQGGYVDSLHMDINPIRLNTILADWWGIDNREDALNTLQYLAQGPYCMVFPAIYKAFTTAGASAQKSVIAEAVGYDEELYTDTWKKLMNLKSCYDELVSNGIVCSKSELECIGVVGWDAGRLNFIARACLDKGYINEQECWQFIDRAYDMAHGSIRSWKDLARSYTLGRALWNGDISIYVFADDLLSKHESPWVTQSW